MWTKESMHELLDRDSRAVERALVAIYKRQTADEQAALATSHSNGVGFSRFDAEFCSDLARKVQRGWSLTPKQLAVARNKMKRYHRQLCEIANERDRPAPAVAPTIEPADEQASIDREMAEMEARAERYTDHMDELAKVRARLVMEAGSFA